MPREKAQAAPTARPKVPMRRERGGLPCSSDEAGVMLVERRGRSPTLGASQLATGGAPILDGRRQPSCGGTSRMTRECQVRMCVQVRLACSAGDSPAGGKSQSPVVRIAEGMETEPTKPIDKI